MDAEKLLVGIQDVNTVLKAVRARVQYRTGVMNGSDKMHLFILTDFLNLIIIYLTELVNRYGKD